MKGDLFLNGHKWAGVHMVSLDEDSSVTFYREVEGEPKDIVTLLRTSIQIDDRRIYIGGFRRVNPETIFPANEPIPGEQYEYMELEFHPLTGIPVERTTESERLGDKK